MSIVRRYSFEAAHQLAWHPGKCRSLHGHSYVLEVEVAGPLDERGVVMDFAELDALVTPLVLARLDHSYLNDVCENPTAERVASMIGVWLEADGVEWKTLRLWETRRGSVLIAHPGRQ